MSEKIYPRLFTALFCSPIMLEAQTRSSFEQVLLQKMGLSSGQTNVVVTTQTAPAPQADATEDQTMPWRTRRVFQRFGSVAIVTIEGVIDKRISAFEMECYGGCDLADIDEALAICRDDPTIRKVILLIHTPGGTVCGTPETAARVADLAAIKEVVAFVPCLCCSAGYYIASQATRIAAAPSARIGSIGTYTAILDLSRQLEMEGIRYQVTQSGKYKTMGAFWKPLTPEETAIFQKNSDLIGERFRQAVTSNRPRVKLETMQGQCFDGIEAEDRWLVDELTGETLDEFASRLLLS